MSSGCSSRPLVVMVTLTNKFGKSEPAKTLCEEKSEENSVRSFLHLYGSGMLLVAHMA